ncbi:hypothetical protein OsI_28744 [Oryza sativa Indica Group]|uniref:Uncharacterized protein n=1 Tax=Oryza sativa subsp. indica TaxID=39946 RepID=B8B9N7_ORYSI|nr:hypothetical protein OsI_28744 [Oryza sativa Indica Group]
MLRRKYLQEGDMFQCRDEGGITILERGAKHKKMVELGDRMADVLNWDRVPLNFDDFFILADIRSDFKHRAVKIALLAAICWTLRTTRNNMWSPLHRLEEKSDLEKLVKRLKEGGGEELA